jgi:predicted anti-sigma-YlaC factor YlaD
MMTFHDRTVPAIDCVEFVRLVDDIVDSDPRRWGAIVTRHLAECPPCLVYLQQMLDLRILLSHVFDGQQLSDEHIAGVIHGIAAFRDGR